MQFRIVTPDMGVQLLTVISHIKLTFLCFVFIHNISVIVMFSVAGNVSDINNTVDQVDEGEEYENVDIELESIKRTMIAGLGYQKIPDVTKMNVSQDEYSRMYDVYLSRLEQRIIDEATGPENVPKFYTFYQKDRHVRRKRRSGVTHYLFNISITDDNASVEHSTLRLLAASSDQSGPVRVKVYQVLDRKKLRLVDERDIFLVAGATKWVEFDVTKAMKNWIEKSEQNLGLELHCAQCKKRKHHSILAADHRTPVINALITIDSNVREKRSAEQMLFYEKNRKTDCHNRNSKKCCRHKKDFDIAELGMEFIIQPKKFDGGICKGRCPPRYNAAHNHAVLQSLMWKKDKSLTPRVCCAPSKLQHLEILTVDEDDPAKLTVKKWENMVVLECACS